VPDAPADPSYACLAMYPFEPIRAAWETLWDAVHRTAPWTPATLRWSDDVHATWSDPNCIVGQACGWPVAARLCEVDVVGAFTLTIPGARGHRYRSVLIGRDQRTLGELAAVGAVAVANSADSLSGWISLLAAVRGAGRAGDSAEQSESDDSGDAARAHWPGPVTWSGAHIDSLRCLHDGRADVGCIDALTLTHIERYFPDLVAGLHVIGHGPLIPSPPVIVPAGTPAALVDSLRDALTEATSDPHLVEPRAALHIDGFVALDHADYAPTLQLATV
jgi:ABC-type phosphate/phosphonate transport system substrate-binding protein